MKMCNQNNNPIAVPKLEKWDLPSFSKVCMRYVNKKEKCYKTLLYWSTCENNREILDHRSRNIKDSIIAATLVNILETTINPQNEEEFVFKMFTYLNKTSEMMSMPKQQKHVVVIDRVLVINKDLDKKEELTFVIAKKFKFYCIDVIVYKRHDTIFIKTSLTSKKDAKSLLKRAGFQKVRGDSRLASAKIITYGLDITFAKEILKIL